MTPNIINRAAVRADQNTIPQPELHGAAIPAPIPTEPESSPVTLPLPGPAPKPPSPQPDPVPNKPVPGPWSGLFFLASESREEFNEFFNHLEDHYMPFNEEERVCVAKLAEARWALARRKRAGESIEAELYSVKPNPAMWLAADFERLALADAYRAQADRVARRTQKNVEAFVKKRLEEQHWQINRELAERRLLIQKSLPHSKKAAA